MDDLQHVITKVVENCAQQGVDDVSKILAALVARTTIYDNPDLFAMDKMLEDTDVDDLCDMCVARLTQKDSPSLSTIRIQVRFDTAYLEHTDAVEAKRVERLNKLNMIKSKILDVHAKSANDFESLTDLYRQIFAFLMVHVGNDTNRDNAVEREVAAALESVFPRIGLKAFMTMSRREKEGQLNELANIVLGIRLFNKDIGKGGAGLADEPSLATLDVSELHGTLQSQVDSLNAECQRYTDVLNYCWENKVPGADESVIKRWQDELTNRRQYLFNIQSLQEDTFGSRDKIEGSKSDFNREMTDLKLLVGSRTSVAKEQVYPKFDVLASLFMVLKEERKAVEARLNTLNSLQELANGYKPTLHDEWVDAARRATREKKMKEQQEQAMLGTGGTGEESKTNNETKDGGEGKTSDESKEGGSSGVEEGKSGEGGGSGPASPAAAFDPTSMQGGDDVPVRLSIDTTPEFMQLPLEFQGYCPHTIVTRNALLLPGNPALGVVRYKNTFNVFVTVQAMEDFMSDPGRFIGGVIDIARKNPELIHLLRLQNNFPAVSNLLCVICCVQVLKYRLNHCSLTFVSFVVVVVVLLMFVVAQQASLSTLVQNKRLQAPGSAGGDGIHPLLGVPAPATRDAGTETPVHFITKNIDPNYDWNEWGLRRRALQIANLRKCSTDGTQTDMSHFRRENESQVYLPRTQETQTKQDNGTNPKRVHTYIAGLRNGNSTQYASKYAEDGDNPTQKTKKKTTVVNLTFEL